MSLIVILPGIIDAAVGKNLSRLIFAAGICIFQDAALISIAIPLMLRRLWPFTVCSFLLRAVLLIIGPVTGVVMAFGIRHIPSGRGFVIGPSKGAGREKKQKGNGKD